jgi:crotonobetainyl-CoA:carnitine CoA-transferase CaiB-like acyl-CoA transferase
VDDPRFATGTARTEHREEVRRICAEVLGTLEAEAALELLDGAGIACGRVNFPEEVLAHPQLAARDRWRNVDSPVGPLRSLLPPPVSPGWELRMDRVPDVGDDTETILAELGLDRAAIDRLIADGVVGEPSCDAQTTA